MKGNEWNITELKGREWNVTELKGINGI